MGLILLFVVGVGCALGLTVTATLGGIGIVITAKGAKSRDAAWRYFKVAFFVILAIALIAVNQYPYEYVRGGSDYDILASNLFLQALGYCAAPGIAGMLAAVAALWAPKAPAKV